MHILLVEDDLDLGRALLQGLRTDGITGEWVRRTVDARHVLDDKTMDCVLLDLSLPDGAGFDLLSDWRQAGLGVPIIIITARATLEERLAGLDGGADDYLVKPFATAELASRIRAVVRRTAQQAAETWTLGDLQIEPKRHLARLGGKPLDLSPREFRLLQELVRQAGTAVSKSDLSARLDPLGEPVDFGAIEVHVSNLRRKIGAGCIRTIRGVGYVLTT
jgi:two-component system response regulator QseB/two-component system response regulator BasR